MSPWWSWVLTGMGAMGIWLAGRGRATGWAVTMASEVAWLAYGVTTRQWGFVAGAVLWAGICAQNWRTWQQGQGGRLSSDCPER